MVRKRGDDFQIGQYILQGCNKPDVTPTENSLVGMSSFLTWRPVRTVLEKPGDELGDSYVVYVSVRNHRFRVDDRIDVKA